MFSIRTRYDTCLHHFNIIILEIKHTALKKIKIKRTNFLEGVLTTVCVSDFAIDMHLDDSGDLLVCLVCSSII